jgi:membrane-bound ClpP family serine protease
MKMTVKDWLIVLASLSDDAAIALFILLVLWLLKIPISLPIIIFVVMLFIVSAFVMHKLVIPALHRKKTTGAEGMIGLIGKVVKPLMPNGLIRVKGEYWEAISVGKNIRVGENVEIIGVDGLTLRVKRKKRSSSPNS